MPNSAMTERNRFTDLFAADDPARIDFATGAVLLRRFALDEAAELLTKCGE
jgi:hypothetical protein